MPSFWKREQSDKSLITFIRTWNEQVYTFYCYEDFLIKMEFQRVFTIASVMDFEILVVKVITVEIFSSLVMWFQQRGKIQKWKNA